MTAHPPHLPPKTCSVRQHHHFHIVLWVVSVVGLAGMTSIAIAWASIAWLVPQFVQHTTFIPVDIESRTTTHLAQDPEFIRQAEQQMVRVFDRSGRVAESLYRPEAFVGHAVMLTSDGWAALWGGTYVKGDERDWDIVDAEGSLLVIEKVYRDPVSNVVYVKFQGNGFRVVNFPVWERIRVGTPLFAAHADTWTLLAIDAVQAIASRTSFVVWNPPATLHLSASVRPGTVLFNTDGQFAGFVFKDDLFATAFLIQDQLAHILADSATSYDGIDAQAVMVNGVGINDKQHIVQGLYITDSATAQTSSTIGIGDVITQVRGQEIRPDRLSELFLSGSSPLSIRVFRKGLEFDMIVE